MCRTTPRKTVKDLLHAPTCGDAGIVLHGGRVNNAVSYTPTCGKTLTVKDSRTGAAQASRLGAWGVSAEGGMHRQDQRCPGQVRPVREEVQQPADPRLRHPDGPPALDAQHQGQAAAHSQVRIVRASARQSADAPLHHEDRLQAAEEAGCQAEARTEAGDGERS